MSNKEIANLLKFFGKLLELHDENIFKVKSYANSSYFIGKIGVPIAGLSENELVNLHGIGKSIASKIIEISTKNTFGDLQVLLEKTPIEVVKMLSITGLGPKKVQTIWKTHQIETIEALKTACEQNILAQIKGIGEKLQEEVYEYLLFQEKSKGKYYYADFEDFAIALEQKLKSIFAPFQVDLIGDMRRKSEIVDKIEFLVEAENTAFEFKKLNIEPDFVQNLAHSSPYIWRGNYKSSELNIEIRTAKKSNYGSEMYLKTASQLHLSQLITEKETVSKVLKSNSFSSENEFFISQNLPFIEPELREGYFEIEAAKNNKLPKLICDSDIKGSFHNHSKYSDGENTIEEMVSYCRELGYSYFGISDHSQTANYAGGLKPDAILKQHAEIDELNDKIGPNFKIFKGIESDILGDGSLDYPNEILKTFDFIVASIHSNLKMDIQKATERLIKAIENPFTTFLGHPTGRLLLRRQGYPIDYQKIIDACAANKVIIEINANPWRLDLDWRYIHYALEKGVMLSVNPDAHELVGLKDVHFGVCVGRKGGLTAEMNFNSKTLADVETYLANRKRKF
ncbi:MAG: DNA polymerase/3'-5' exonuclease PolX [Bacteroidetes bacterium]|nr:MAG: DNA polymerase/3'-5' exonuclease PolX [Bacteroidota bacterium]